ncbi:MAG TPA: BON domain-containing protein [Verrucomicrobiae bacterium]|nr:BON domain-containing protein [Verrucomicrobiae bacterium]
MISLLAMGCTIHEPTYYTIYKPEKHSSSAAGGASGIATNRQMNATGQVNSGNPNDQHIYAEAPGTSLSPVSSNSASRIYSEPGSQAQSGGQGQQAGSASKTLALTWMPQDEGVTEADRAIIRRIRQAWVQDYALSLTATGLKIIADHGKVTISGPVDTEQEKERLAALVKNTPGVISVQDQLAVKL